MSSAHAAPIARHVLPQVPGYPPTPRPFDMEAWRKAWGAWWSQANRAAIRAVIPEGK